MYSSNKNNKNQIEIRKITILSVFCVIAYVAVLLIRVPIIPGFDYLTFEPKDVIIVIAGFIFGPLASISIALIVSLIEMITISHTGIIGFLMNSISSIAFALPSAIIYCSRRKFRSAVIGLCSGILTMTAAMLLWNYAITPVYTGISRNEIAVLLPKVFLPFNLIKSILNSAITMCIYRPFNLVLRKIGILPSSELNTNKTVFTISVSVVSLLVVIAIITLISIIY